MFRPVSNDARSGIVLLKIPRRFKTDSMQRNGLRSGFCSDVRFQIDADRWFRFFTLCPVSCLSHSDPMPIQQSSTDVDPDDYVCVEHLGHHEFLFWGKDTVTGYKLAGYLNLLVNHSGLITDADRQSYHPRSFLAVSSVTNMQLHLAQCDSVFVII